DRGVFTVGVGHAGDSRKPRARRAAPGGENGCVRNRHRTRGAVPGQRQDGAEEWCVVLAWIVLIGSGVLEAVWATALGRSDGFTRPVPTTVFGVAVVVSMVGLAWAMRTLPTGTAYAVWVGIGAGLTVVYEMVSGAEPFAVVRLLLVAGIIGCVIGLKLVS